MLTTTVVVEAVGMWVTRSLRRVIHISISPLNPFDYAEGARFLQKNICIIDSGQYWYEEGKLALPFHEIEIATTQVLFDSIGIGKDVVITVLGASPVGSMDRAIEITGDVAHSLQAGDEAIFFVVERELAWQNETRSIIRFMGNPLTGYLTKGDNGSYYLNGVQTDAGMSFSKLLERITER